MEERKIDVAGTTMRWLEHGEGAPVVLLHGVPTSPQLWRYVMPLVGARTLAWEMPGYGTSMNAAAPDGLGLASQAGYLLAWLEAIGVSRAVFAGHDLGGGVAQIAALKRPEMCAGLVLVNSVSYDSWPIAPVRAMQRMNVLARLMVRGTFRKFVEQGHDNAQRGRESAELHWRPYASAGGWKPLVRQIKALDTKDTLDIADRLPSLEVPARVVWGENDPFQAIGYGERLARDLETAVDRIEGAKHFVPEDHPERVAAAIDDLLPETDLAEERAPRKREPSRRGPRTRTTGKTAGERSRARKDGQKRSAGQKATGGQKGAAATGQKRSTATAKGSEPKKKSGAKTTRGRAEGRSRAKDAGTTKAEGRRRSR